MVFAFAAAAEASGYRACLRCRPYRSSPALEWSTGPELVCRAVHMIIDGALERKLPLTGDPIRSVFRIHRDIRFSRDKSPYKTHVAPLTPFGVFTTCFTPATAFVALSSWRRGVPPGTGHRTTTAVSAPGTFTSMPNCARPVALARASRRPMLLPMVVKSFSLSA